MPNQYTENTIKKKYKQLKIPYARTIKRIEAQIFWQKFMRSNIYV